MLLRQANETIKKQETKITRLKDIIKNNIEIKHIPVKVNSKTI